MSKQHIPAPVPPGNQPHVGPVNPDTTESKNSGHGQTEGFEEQDPKKRQGGFVGAGEHSIHQPTDLNDGTRHAK